MPGESSFAGLDPRDSVVMTADPLAGLASGPRQPFTAAEWTSDDPDRPALLVTTRAPGLLVVADTWMPGWTATADGRPAPVLRGNYAQRVIALHEPGRHVIAMEYHPPGLVLGCVISIAAAAAWGILAVWHTGAGRRLMRGKELRRRGKPGLHQDLIGPAIEDRSPCAPSVPIRHAHLE